MLSSTNPFDTFCSFVQLGLSSADALVIDATLISVNHATTELPSTVTGPTHSAAGQVAMAIVVVTCALSAGSTYAFFQDASDVLVYGSTALWLITAAVLLATNWKLGLIPFVLAVAATVYTGDLTTFDVTHLPMMTSWVVLLIVLLITRPSRLERQPLARGLSIAAVVWLVLVAIGSTTDDFAATGFGIQQGVGWQALSIRNLVNLGGYALLVAAVFLLAFRPAVSLGIAILMGIKNQVEITYIVVVQDSAPGTPWTYDAQLIATAALTWLAVAGCALVLLRRLANDVSAASNPASVSTAPE